MKNKKFWRNFLFLMFEFVMGILTGICFNKTRYYQGKIDGQRETMEAYEKCWKNVVSEMDNAKKEETE